MKKRRRLVKKTGTVIVITCVSCGWRWKPNPKQWRNTYNPVSDRALPCPSCGKKNWIDVGTVKKIRKHNRR